MADFGALLKKPASGQTRPTVFAIGEYPGIITKFEPIPPATFKGKGGNDDFEKPWQIRVMARVTGLPEGMTAEECGGDQVGSVFKRDYDYQNKDGSDAAKLWQLNALLESVGVTPNGESYDALLPQLQGKPVLMSVGQYNDKETGQPGGNQINKMAGFEHNA